jgi:hypothetical protein
MVSRTKSEPSCYDHTFRPKKCSNTFSASPEALAGLLDFQSMINAVSEQIRFILPHDHLDVSLLLLNAENHLHTAYEAGVHTSWSGFAKQPLPVSQSPLRTLLLGKRPSSSVMTR